MDFYYKNAFFSTLVILIIVLPVYFLYQRRKYMNFEDNRSRVSKVASLLLIAYIAAVVAVLIVPYWQFFIFDGKAEFYFLDTSERVLNLIPFKTISEQIDGIRYGDFGLPFRSLFNILVNLCIFIPLPILFKLSNERIALPATVLIAFIFSFVCEFVQYFIGRSSDVDDLILNTLGSFIGCGIYLIAEKIIKKHIAKKNTKAI